MIRLTPIRVMEYSQYFSLYPNHPNQSENRNGRCLNHLNDYIYSYSDSESYI